MHAIYIYIYIILFVYVCSTIIIQLYCTIYIYIIIHTHAIRFCKQNTVVIVLFRARSEPNSPTLSQVTLPFDVQPEEPAAPRLSQVFVLGIRWETEHTELALHLWFYENTLHLFFTH